MAYRFKINENIGEGAIRIAREQIARAREHQVAGGGNASAVHETRKCMKRIRALLRLVRPGLGDSHFRRENARFRDISALMSAARDNQVMLETVVRLESGAGQGNADFFEALRCMLQRKAVEDSARAGAATRPAEIIAALDGADAALACLSIEPSGLSMLGEGFERAYARGRKALRRAGDGGTDEDFHELRKSVQLHWRHMQLVGRIWPELAAARMEAARRLSQLIGDDHDLAVLAAALNSSAVAHLSGAECHELVRMAEGRQAEIRAAVMPRAEQLFAQGPRAMSRHVIRLWRAARDIADAPPPEPAEAVPAARGNGKAAPSPAPMPELIVQPKRTA